MSALAVCGGSPGAAAYMYLRDLILPSVMRMSLSGHQRKPATVALGSTLPSKVTRVAISVQFAYRPIADPAYGKAAADQTTSLAAFSSDALTDLLAG